MIIPLHLLPEDMPELTYSIGGQAVDPALRPQSSVDLASPIAGPVAMDQLLRFQELMALKGRTISPIRMVYDKLYACERLAEAYRSDHAGLRELAISIYEGYERAGEWVALVH